MTGQVSLLDLFEEEVPKKIRSVARDDKYQSRGLVKSFFDLKVTGSILSCIKRQIIEPIMSGSITEVEASINHLIEGSGLNVNLTDVAFTDMGFYVACCCPSAVRKNLRISSRKYVEEDVLKYIHPVQISITDGQDKIKFLSSLSSPIVAGKELKGVGRYEGEWCNTRDFGKFMSDVYLIATINNFLKKEDNYKGVCYDLFKCGFVSIEKLTDDALAFSRELGEFSSLISTKVATDLVCNRRISLRSMYSDRSFCTDDHEVFLYHGDIGLYQMREQYGKHRAFMTIVDNMLGIKSSLEEEEKEMNRLKSTYAASYETKKNIPQKTLDAMKESKLNQYFSYVEFDELVDLTKMHQVENEIIKFVSGLDFFEGLTIRFRRLGKHKAAGLYYPFFKTICVDIHSVGSFAHEWFHAYDYANEASEMFDFHVIKSLYRDLLRNRLKSLPKDSPEKKRLSGGTKYNLSYYLNEKEVFARCGEIYISRILKLETSLVDDLDGFEYPEDATLNQEIEKYYSRIIKRREAYAC